MHRLQDPRRGQGKTDTGLNQQPAPIDSHPAATTVLVTGRFAPSPTGPLHFGSLLAATASFLQAKARTGRWLVRIEDLDPPREPVGASSDILRTLDLYGLHWDGEVVYQSRRTELYSHALDQLLREGLAYPCTCSRKEVARTGRDGPFGPVYPGTCRNRHQRASEATSIRALTPDLILGFEDGIQGPYRYNLACEAGDFVIRRRGGLTSYQLAVVIDDAQQGITEVVRGTDLLNSTPRQILLQEYLGLATPSYLHLPVAVHPDGEKLSKQTGAPPLPLDDPLPPVLAALSLLGQRPPQELLDDTVEDIWNWAVTHWRPEAIPRALELRPPPSFNRDEVRGWPGLNLGRAEYTPRT